MDDLEAVRNGEIWLPVIGFEKAYQVSNEGRVRRVCMYCGDSHTRAIKPTPIKRGDNPNAYLSLSLFACRKKKRKLVHVVVAEAFIGPNPGGLDVNHKDGDKTNNRLDNLEYVTRSENHEHAYRTGIRHVKLTQVQVREIRELEGKLPSRAVGRRYGVSKTHVLYIWRDKAWAHLE